MSPSREGGGSARPSPLTIFKDSYLIRKAHLPPPPMSPSSSNSVASSGNINSHHYLQRQQRRPVIIYTQSPKVIHTEPHNFMALVQKLTGMVGSIDYNTSGSSARPPPAQSRPRGCARSECDGVKAVPAGSDDSSTTSENSGDEDAHGVQVSPAAPAVSPPAVLYPPSTCLFLPDVPIFTPTASYCYPSHFYYRSCSDVGFSPSEICSSMIFSPSVKENIITYSDRGSRT